MLGVGTGIVATLGILHVPASVFFQIAAVTAAGGAIGTVISRKMAITGTYMCLCLWFRGGWYRL